MPSHQPPSAIDGADWVSPRTSQEALGPERFTYKLGGCDVRVLDVETAVIAYLAVRQSAAVLGGELNAGDKGNEIHCVGVMVSSKI